MIKQNLIKLYEESFTENFDLPALTDYITDQTLTYGDLAKRIAILHLIFKRFGVEQGDKVLLIGRNTPNWVVSFMATITYGAVIVPVLHEFNINDVKHIINHSESVLLIVGDNIWDDLEIDGIDNVRAILSLEGFDILHTKNSEDACCIDELYHKEYPADFAKQLIDYPQVDNSEVIEINYTSGTTGFSKGVMITANNLVSNVCFGIDTRLHYRKSRALSFLPLAHVYGCAFDMLTPLAVGSHITLLGKLPSPKVLLTALAKVKPHLIVCVPLVFEKIYRKQVLPKISHTPIKLALNLPVVKAKIFDRIRKQITDALGGEFEQVIIGGAPLNPEVERFFKKIKFPITVGYGMTECAPLISYSHHSQFVERTSGQILSCMEVKIESTDANLIPGEICVRGENVMKGYYKNPEATAQVIDSEGWLRTGDMGVVDHEGRITIKGRSKNMILGASGQNIYPEEIEAKINILPFVMESLVIEKSGRLVALVYPDYEAVDQCELPHDDLDSVMEEIRKEVNKVVAPYETLAKIYLYPNEFEKTPKKSIKRYLYTNFTPIEL